MEKLQYDSPMIYPPTDDNGDPEPSPMGVVAVAGVFTVAIGASVGAVYSAVLVVYIGLGPSNCGP